MPRRIFIAKEHTMRPRGQRGWVEERGTKRRYWYGHYTLHIKNENDTNKSQHAGEWLGWKSETTKSSAEQKLQKIIFERVGAEARPSDAATLSLFWETRFLVMKSAGWSARTARGNKYDFKKYIAPALGAVALRDLNQFRLQQHINSLAERSLSESLVRRCKTLLSSILALAVDLEYISKNPVEKVTLPRCKPSAKHVLSSDDLSRLLAAVIDTRDRLILMLGALGGARTSEVFGLTWDCYKGDHVEIRNTAYDGELHEWRVKRKASFRRLWLSPETQKLFEKWRQENDCSTTRRSDSSGHGLVRRAGSLVFPGRSGPLWPGVWLQKHIQPIARRLGITTPITFQVLRRSCATRNQEHGSLKDIGAHLGHGSIQVTGDVYMQAVPESVKRMTALDEENVLRRRVQ